MLGLRNPASSTCAPMKTPTTMRMGTYVGPELHHGDGGGGDEAQRPADEGNEAHEPGAEPDEQAIPQAGRGEAQGIIDGEHEAHGSLAADEGGDRRVDVAGKPADGRRVLARQPGIDLGEHRVPVDQHVEHDERRHQDEREEIEEREPLAPQRARERAGEARPVVRRAPARRGRARSRSRRSGAPSRSRAHASSSVAQARASSSGSATANSCAWVSSERHQEHQRGHDGAHEDRDDQHGGEPARQAPSGQPVGGGIEEVGDDDAGDEGQQDRVAAARSAARAPRRPRARTAPVARSAWPELSPLTLRETAH